VIAICAWCTNIAFLIHSESTRSQRHSFKRTIKLMGLCFLCRYRTREYFHPPRFSGSADSWYAGPRDMGAYARRLPRASYREHQKNHLRCARFRCGLTPYNARWPASPASTRPHAWLGAVPLEAGRQWTLVHPDCLFCFL
jgi:hypothetical protein